jgi:tetratricopeptide (TPR) repeat protein
MIAHLDDFTALLYTVDELAPDDRRTAASHLAACESCTAMLAEIRELDGALRDSESSEALAAEAPALADDDPFRRRPQPRPTAFQATGGIGEPFLAALAASEAADLQRERIADPASPRGTLEEMLEVLALENPLDRFTLLYALQQSGREIAENPTRALGLAEATLKRLEREGVSAAETASTAEREVPWLSLWGQAHILAAQARIWTKDLSEAGAHLRAAYRSFGRIGDETGLAVVELTESQRRSFAREGETALVLARRARETFESRGLDDLAARGMVAEGLAYFDLDRQEEALAAYRRALPVFERLELWSNYVGTLNSIGTSLQKLGRLDEARREFARALRRFSSARHRAWTGYLRQSLAEILWAAGRYRDAAISAARSVRAFRESGMRADALIVSLLEVECWARFGSFDRARGRLELFWDEIDSQRALDPEVARGLAEALSGTNPDFEKLGMLRDQIEGLLKEHFANEPA